MRYLKATTDVTGVAGVVSMGGARRWSTATQSITGVSNTSHQSLHNNEDARKISFVLQDQDNESIGSSKNSLCGNVTVSYKNFFYIQKQSTTYFLIPFEYQL